MTRRLAVPDRRGGSSSTAQAKGIIACDFLHADTITGRRIYILIFVEHASRRLHVAGVAAAPTGGWVTQQARNLAMTLDRRMESLRFLIRDRDTKYLPSFDGVFDADGVEIIKSPPRAPKANSVCERLVGTLRREVLDRILIVNERHLLEVLGEFRCHYNEHRPHQELDQRSPDDTCTTRVPSASMSTRSTTTPGSPSNNVVSFIHARSYS